MAPPVLAASLVTTLLAWLSVKLPAPDRSKLAAVMAPAAFWVTWLPELKTTVPVPALTLAFNAIVPALLVSVMSPLLVLTPVSVGVQHPAGVMLPTVKPTAFKNWTVLPAPVDLAANTPLTLFVAPAKAMLPPA